MNLYPIVAATGSLADDKGMLTLIVTICGILMVFVALILLIIVISIFGKVLSNAGKKAKKAKKEKKTETPASAAVPTKAAAPAAKASAPVPVNNASGSNGIPDEIIAVIAAAVAAMDDGAYVIRNVKRSREGRPAWSMAGIYENTRPF